MMWPFRKKHSLAESGIFCDFTDWHSHILPGVDDGVQTMDEALDVLAMYEKLGVETVWFTPHIMEDVPNTTAHLKERFEELKTVYKGSVCLRLSAEYMLDNLFVQRLETNDLLPLGEKGDHLLVETSYYNPPANLYRLLDEIKSKGYYPVFAHPERYTYMGKKDYCNLKEANVKFQLNIPSISGFYGTVAQDKAQWLLKEDWYDLTGTDTHGIKMFQTCLDSKIKYKPLINA